MEKMEFLRRMEEVATVMPEGQLKQTVKDRSRGMGDLPTCMGELNELALELTRFQRNKMDPADFLQELSHVQWAVWTLQALFGVEDEALRRAIQASFR